MDKYIENPPADYDVPAEYLDDATFSALLTEAEKYLGYPYVWGGSSPDTSFDCSGFVSYVLTNSGLVNTGRLGAQGLYNICTPISSPQPGDLVFFQGTYDTSGVSHVGIYVGDQVMLHCGDPIQYTSISSSYWQSHFFLQAQLKELYDRKTEMENLEIINTVRAMVMDKDQIMAFLSTMKGGAPQPDMTETEVSDHA